MTRETMVHIISSKSVKQQSTPRATAQPRNSAIFQQTASAFTTLFAALDVLDP